MNDADRLNALETYQILDTVPEKEFDDITELASAICNTPISLLTLLDKDRQWFKAKKGLAINETSRLSAFCNHALEKPQELLIVQNAKNDPRFATNPLVLDAPNIEFYAGAPLVTPGGYVLGTLCVIDNKTNKLTNQQKKALRILADRVIQMLEERKARLKEQRDFQSTRKKLEKIAHQAPGALYIAVLKTDGTLSFPYVSDGVNEIHPDLSPDKIVEDANVIFSLIEETYLDHIRSETQASARNLSRYQVTFPIQFSNNVHKWFMANAVPEHQPDGSTMFYGHFQDITETMDYVATLEDILFDISHVIRKPVANIQGLANHLENNNPSHEDLVDFASKFRSQANVLDEQINRLNKDYYEKKTNFAKNKPWISYQE